MIKVACILLAAGSSTRMGKNKLMLPLNGETLVKRAVKEIQKYPFHDVVVVSGFEAQIISEELSSLSPRIIFNADHLTGMHSSIKAGVKSLRPGFDAFFVCLSDLPYFDHNHFKILAQHFDEDSKSLVVPICDEKRGHPVLISSSFIPEIMNWPDGDYGCAYLFKRHPDKVHSVNVDSTGILIDVDRPQDYARILEKDFDNRDPVENFYLKTLELRRTGNPFVIASVVEVIGSSSARVGSKAIFDNQGRNLLGWVGGGCAERFIAEESLAAIREAKPRVILANMDDEIFGLGVVCGGKMKVFIDPILPPETIHLPETPKFQQEVRTLSGLYGWNIKRDASKASPHTVKELICLMAKTVAEKRSRAGKSLREIKEVPASFVNIPRITTRDVLIIGRTRITETLARHFELLDYNVKVVGPNLNQEDYPKNVECFCLDDGYQDIAFKKNDIVIIASHTSHDPELVKKALAAQASYVGMIGSLKRSHEVLSYLSLMHQKVVVPLYIPAGLDIDARNPDEIALSVLAEIIQLEGGAPV